MRAHECAQAAAEPQHGSQKKERWVNRPDGPTTLNCSPVRVRARPDARLEHAIVQATKPEMFFSEDALTFWRVTRAARNVVSCGDCYAYA